VEYDKQTIPVQLYSTQHFLQVNMAFIAIGYILLVTLIMSTY